MMMVWEWCKDIWYSNHGEKRLLARTVWEWCKDIWYSNLQNTLQTNGAFENDVKIYGIQTYGVAFVLGQLFENDVKIYGIQTWKYLFFDGYSFENDVKIYGIQTFLGNIDKYASLRMM